MTKVGQQFIRVHKVFFDIYCANDMNFFWHLRGRLKQTFQKTAVFTMKEVFGPFFFVLSSVTKLKEQIIRVYRLLRQLLWNLLEHFLGPKRLLKSQIFEKKANFSVKKNFCSIFSRNIDHENWQGTFYKGLQGILTLIVQIL